MAIILLIYLHKFHLSFFIDNVCFDNFHLIIERVECNVVHNLMANFWLEKLNENSIAIIVCSDRSTESGIGGGYFAKVFSIS